jgi:hypothetical protein
MTASVVAMHQPNTAAMREHLEHLFGGFLDGHGDGMIELAWTDSRPDASGKYKLSHARLFGTDQVEELIEEAVRVNSQPMVNAYIGAALRKPDTAPFGRGKDVDFYALTCMYGDLDEEDANKHARHKFAPAPPSFVVRTGDHPHMRHQVWWRLEQPITDPAQAESLIKGAAIKLNGDVSVSNPGRVMRLAGSIAWGQKPGRITEVTRIVPLKNKGRDQYPLEMLERFYPPAKLALRSEPRERNERGPDNGIVRQLDTFGHETGKVVDGRERHMVRVICAGLIDFVGENGASPSADDLFEIAWPVYERTTDLMRAGRGEDEFRQKCAYTVRRFEREEIPGLETLDKVVEAYEKKAAERPFDGEVPEELPQAVAAALAPRPIRTFDFASLITENVPEEPDLIAPNLLAISGFLLVGGPPKAQKSWFVQDLLVSAAIGVPFLGDTFTIARPLRVFWLQAEMNEKLLRRRAKAATGLTPDMLALLRTNMIVSDRFRMILDPNGVEVAAKLMRESFGGELPDIIAFDPMANIFDQENENDNAQVMKFLTQRIEAVRQLVNPDAGVVLVHHATKKGPDEIRKDPFNCFRGGGALRGHYDSGVIIFRKDDIGDEREVHFEFRGGDTPDPMTVRLEGGAMVKVAPAVHSKDPKKGWPDKPTCRLILQAIQSAWNGGDPWSSMPQTKNVGRYAPTIIRSQFGVSENVAEAMVREWLINKVLAVKTANSDTKQKGLEVVGSIDG